MQGCGDLVGVGDMLRPGGGVSVVGGGGGFRGLAFVSPVAGAAGFMWFGGGNARWGDLVWLYIPRHPELTGYWVVRDTMAETVYRGGVEVPLVQHIDLLTEEYGRWTGYALLVGGG